MSDPTLLERIVIEPPGTADAAIIWLHGLGADGHDFEGIVPHLGLAQEHGVRFIFPHAPMQPVTINGGMVMRAWYDITDMNLGRFADEAGIRASGEQLAALVAAQRSAGIASERIILAGFSQGGVIALHTALRHGEPLGGVMALSTYLGLPDALDAEKHPANESVSIFMGHGTGDPVVPLELAEKSAKRLQQSGYAVAFHRYPMPHSVIPEEISDIARWLRERLGAA